MKIQFLGAAQTVTGSCHMMETGGHRFAVDCGMHQGNTEIEKRNQSVEHYRPRDIEFFLITHAHIDHSGLLPKMAREGFSGRIYCTPPTRDLLEIMLRDSAHIQEMEAEWKSRKYSRRGNKTEEPLYGMADAEKVIGLLETVEYDVPFHPFPELSVRYKDAGHILGSSFIELCVTEEGGEFKAVFSGDLGRPDQLLMSDPSIIQDAHYLFLESTYGDRNHKDEGASRDELAAAIEWSHRHGEKVIIPAFAVERTQEVLYTLHLLEKEGRLPADMPVYVDSPMAIRATEVFRKYADYFDEETRAIYEAGEDPLSLRNLRFTSDTQQSMAINQSSGSAIVISASGMCNAGRIKHHLRHNLWRPGASVVFVGFQGKGTPGRKIVDGAKKIRILGEEIAVKAKVFTIGGFSAHAGQSQILEWLEHFRTQDMKVFLVHGENSAQHTLAELITQRFGLEVHIPDYLEECSMVAGRPLEYSRDEERARPAINWDYLLAEAEAKLADVRARTDVIRDKPWVDQTELRDRLLAINKELIEFVSEV
ncbi:metallo-beta-lactamase family protein [Desulfobaculum xiamenense]|uniref:Metallo-beta-lactamase family protein n=1 Tax=Desulfobaculum xiamenense TaxID=995050 RepID=A0A846QHN9_9BACT|nr:MBL fold metallo-hydrolase [Desulfobaculum xiamenense]NJB66630.1 metallo-beta-lactamase family protein [Desulfobaculum xiamenense]